MDFEHGNKIIIDGPEPVDGEFIRYMSPGSTRSDVCMVKITQDGCIDTRNGTRMVYNKEIHFVPITGVNRIKLTPETDKVFGGILDEI